MIMGRMAWLAGLAKARAVPKSRTIAKMTLTSTLGVAAHQTRPAEASVLKP